MKDENYIEITLVSEGERKSFTLPHAQLDIEDIKKRGITSLAGDTLLDDITDYYRFIITAYGGYTEPLDKDLK